MHDVNDPEARVRLENVIGGPVVDVRCTLVYTLVLVSGICTICILEQILIPSFQSFKFEHYIRGEVNY